MARAPGRIRIPRHVGLVCSNARRHSLGQRNRTPGPEQYHGRNIAEIEELVALLESLEITPWSVFFLVPTGPGKLSDLLNAEEFEQVFAKLYTLSKTASFDIKTT
jgi:hypothetical protein